MFDDTKNFEKNDNFLIKFVNNNLFLTMITKDALLS